MTDKLANILDLNALATAFTTASAAASAPSTLTSDTSMGPAQPEPAAAGSSTVSSDKRAVMTV